MRADRLISILLLLQSRGRMTAGELADAMRVSERTIYRDLDALSLSGIPIYSEFGPGGGYALMDSYRTDLTGLNETEIRTLFLSGVYAPLADLGLAQALEDALLKLSAALPTSQRRDLEHARQRIHLDTMSWFYPAEPVPCLRLLQEATWKNRRVRILYQSWADEQPYERLIAPYGLVSKANAWYVVAQRDEEMRVYRVSRIQSAEMTEQPFERPAEFNLAEFWEDACARFLATLPQYPVRMRIAPTLTQTLPQVWGDGIRRLSDHADGWMTIEHIFEDQRHAQRVILPYGAQIEVLDPPELREALAGLAMNMAALYGRDGG